MKYRNISTILFLALFIIVPIHTAQAEEKVGYSVLAEIPENQIDKNLSYFDLRVEANQQQELIVNVYNHENEEITVKTNVYNASTNSNGLITYESQAGTGPTLENPITELVTLENEKITIPAGESTPVKFFLETTSEAFDGVKLGGLHFEKVLDETDQDEGVTIQNNYAYVIGLQLSENDRELEPELVLDFIKPELVNHRTAIVANIQNTQPMITGNISVQAKVFDKENVELLKEVNQNQITFAPNSSMDIIIDWGNRLLQEGEYQLEMVATDGEQEWKWEEEFTINKEDEKINDNAVEIKSTVGTSNWYIIGIISLGLIVILLLLYIRKLKAKK